MIDVAQPVGITERGADADVVSWSLFAVVSGSAMNQLRRRHRVPPPSSRDTPVEEPVRQ